MATDGTLGRGLLMEYWYCCEELVLGCVTVNCTESE